MIGKKLKLTDQLGEMLCETTNYIACDQPAESTFIAPVPIVSWFQLKADSNEGRHSFKVVLQRPPQSTKPVSSSI